jgi:hypothetical protein
VEQQHDGYDLARTHLSFREPDGTGFLRQYPALAIPFKYCTEVMLIVQPNFAIVVLQQVLLPLNTQVRCGLYSLPRVVLQPVIMLPKYSEE